MEKVYCSSEPSNRTVSVMTRLESKNHEKRNSSGKLLRPNRSNISGQQTTSICSVHPISATSIQQTAISVSPSRQLCFQEPCKMNRQRSLQQPPVTKSSSNPYANVPRYIPCPYQQPVTCTCSTGGKQQRQQPVVRQSQQGQQRVPCPIPAQCQQNQPTVQICYSPGSQSSYMNGSNGLIREQPTRDNDIEDECVCGESESALAASSIMMSSKNNTFKVSPTGYAEMNCMEAVEQPDTICLPCGHTFPEGPKDTCWRVKIMKDVGVMTKGFDSGIQTQTSETRIINADKLEELLPPEARYDLSNSSKLRCAPCIEAGLTGESGCLPSPLLSDDYRHESCTSQAHRRNSCSQDNIRTRPNQSIDESVSKGSVEDYSYRDYPEHEQKSRKKIGCIIM